jgi:hypothetical protein
MYCPKCGQQQIADEMRFCSRCGFQLEVVNSLIATGGVPQSIIVPDAQRGLHLASKPGARQGAKLMFASGVLLPVALGFSFLVDSPLPLFIPFTIFLAGLAWMLYLRLFGDVASPADPGAPPVRLSTATQAYLPASHGEPVHDVNTTSTGRTAEMARPHSVTENTTKLLDES